MISDAGAMLTSLLRRLERLILSANNLKTLARTSKVNPTISHLSLTGDSIDSWSSLNALNRQLPALESLWISDNPLFAGLEEADARLEVIARVRDLSELEGSRVSRSLCLVPALADLVSLDFSDRTRRCRDLVCRQGQQGGGGRLREREGTSEVARARRE